MTKEIETKSRSNLFRMENIKRNQWRFVTDPSEIKPFVLDLNKYYGTNGKLKTLGLLVEYNQTENTPLFTIREYDIIITEGKWKGTYLHSLKRLYMNVADPTEYEFANIIFGSWQHWSRIAKSKTFSFHHLNEWREELAVKLESQALIAMIETATQDGSKGTSAAKFIVKEGLGKLIEQGKQNRSRYGESLDSSLEHEESEEDSIVIDFLRKKVK